MKKVGLLLSILFVLVLVGPVQAIPNLYTFSGTIDSFMSPDEMVDSGLEIDDEVSYTWLIDFDVDPIGSEQDFYAELMSEPYYFDSEPTAIFTSLSANDDWTIQIEGNDGYDIVLSSFGEDFSIMEYQYYGVEWHDDDTFTPLYRGFVASLTLDSVTPATAPVPEPSTIVLMGLGLVGLAGMGRKKLYKK